MLIIVHINFEEVKAQSAYNKQLTLWYNQPAANWEKESLPIGNGAMGASIMGGINKEEVIFNEKTLWSGGPGTKGYTFGNGRGDLREGLAIVRKRIDSQTVAEPNWVSKTLGSEKIAFGDYQVFGTLHIDDNMPSDKISNYKRQLNLDQGVASVSYDKNGVAITRTYFASFPDKSVIIRISANTPKSLSYKLSINMPKTRKASFVAQDGIIRAFGRLEDNNLYFESTAKITNTGGERKELSDGSIEINGADEIVIILSAATNYKQQYPLYRGELPEKVLKNRLVDAGKLTYQTLLNRHQKDYQSLFQRVKLELEESTNSIPTDSLLKIYRIGKATLDQQRTLESIFFQYGRYLLISCSREGSPPANLQGVWNNVVNPPWNSDYHHNINLQMNYWLAETTNLTETAKPLFDHINSLVEPGKNSAKTLYHAPGWITHLDMNIYGFTGIGNYSTSFWFPEAGAWLSQHLYEHFLFTNDKNFLRKRTYPVMKGAAEFWLSQLQRDPRDGKLVVTPSFSPENERFGYVSGASMSQQIIKELFLTTLNSAKILDVDKALRERLIATIPDLDSGLRIGSWGQLQEWKHDADSKTDHHRHVSHLYALHPGRKISPITTPELAEAAKISLLARGDGGTGWSKAWKINFWARLLDGDHSHKMLSEQLKESTYPNLWDAHPPFQIDGNFGATSGIAEMLLQSQNGELHLLPALPKTWSNGSIVGLRARGGYIVDLTWENMQLKEVVIHANKTGPIQIRSTFFNTNFNLNSDSKSTKINGRQEGVFKLECKEGEVYIFSQPD